MTSRLPLLIALAAACVGCTRLADAPPVGSPEFILQSGTSPKARGDYAKLSSRCEAAEVEATLKVAGMVGELIASVQCTKYSKQPEVSRTDEAYDTEFFLNPDGTVCAEVTLDMAKLEMLNKLPCPYNQIPAAFQLAKGTRDYVERCPTRALEDRCEQIANRGGARTTPIE